MSHRPEPDRYPLRYTGPTTLWGLPGGARCRRLPEKRGGLVTIETADGMHWRVPPALLEPTGRGRSRRGP